MNVSVDLVSNEERPITIFLDHDRPKISLTGDEARRLVKHLAEALTWLGRKKDKE